MKLKGCIILVVIFVGALYLFFMLDRAHVEDITEMKDTACIEAKYDGYVKNSRYCYKGGDAYEVVFARTEEGYKVYGVTK